MSTPRQVLLCLLAALLTMQGAVATALALMGPLHRHQAPAALASPPVAHVLSAFGHFHAGDAPLRHHHAAGDPTLLHDGADPGEAWQASPTLAAFVALIAAPVDWPVSAPRADWTPRPSWQPHNHSSHRLERPPRAA